MYIYIYIYIYIFSWVPTLTSDPGKKSIIIVFKKDVLYKSRSVNYFSDHIFMLHKKARINLKYLGLVNCIRFCKEKLFILHPQLNKLELDLFGFHNNENLLFFLIIISNNSHT